MTPLSSEFFLFGILARYLHHLRTEWRSLATPRRFPCRVALAAAMLSGCQGALDLGSYTFAGSAGSGGAGPGGAGGGGSPAGGSGAGDAGSNLGGSNFGGSNFGGSDFGGSGGSAGSAGGGGSSSDAGVDGGPDGVCAATERCVPAIPIGWQGPIVLGAADSGCPSDYPTILGQVQTDFQAGGASCQCNCVLTGVSCRIGSSSGGFFDPAGSCDTPPVDDDCLSARSDATCSLSSVIDSIVPSDFDTTLVSCGGGAAAGACSGGSCYPASDGSNALCISAVGEVACPSGFPQQTIYFQGVADTRACSECSCAPQGQLCEVEIEVCSVGFFTTTLREGEACTQLSSSDGDGVTLLSPAVLQQGACAQVGDGLAGSTAPADPITVCCME